MNMREELPTKPIMENGIESKTRSASPEKNGWEKIADTLRPHYMTKDPAPSSLLELTTCQCRKSECQSNCSCANINLACTEACMCMGSVDSCSNPHGTLVDTNDDDSSLQSE